MGGGRGWMWERRLWGLCREEVRKLWKLEGKVGLVNDIGDGVVVI